MSLLHVPSAPSYSETKRDAFGCWRSLPPHLLHQAPPPPPTYSPPPPQANRANHQGLVPTPPPTALPVPSWLCLHIPNPSLLCFIATASGQLMCLDHCSLATSYTGTASSLRRSHETLACISAGIASRTCTSDTIPGNESIRRNPAADLYSRRRPLRTPGRRAASGYAEVCGGVPSPSVTHCAILFLRPEVSLALQTVF